MSTWDPISKASIMSDTFLLIGNLSYLHDTEFKVTTLNSNGHTFWSMSENGKYFKCYVKQKRFFFFFFFLMLTGCTVFAEEITPGKEESWPSTTEI